VARVCFPLLLVAVTLAGTASAQNLSVQQPSVSNFSVGTTVVVPDQGGAFLGGVRRGAMGRSSYGPFRSGSALGLESSGGGISTHVQIHDMAEMDRQILASAPARDESRARLSPRAEHAWQSLRSRQGGTAYAGSNTGAIGSAPENFKPLMSAQTVEQGQAYLAKGRAAVARGKVELAKVYFRMADKLGVREAKSELALANQKSPRTVTR